ncbi:MAG TPA: FHA domain-containing protein [Steroidobacteraceae bacterium]|jgi:type II secretory pathway predicted ATPase ExeA
MYPQFFGFDKLPFRLRPDPDFLYSGAEYLRARKGVLAALRGSARVVVLLGSPGVGKTLLLDDVLREIAGQYTACRINQPHISATELLQALILQLGTTTTAADANPGRLFADLTEALEAADARDVPPLLVIDDAHLLNSATLLALGDILARASRFKILLVAQDDAGQHGAGLAARIALAKAPQQVLLAPLSAESTRAYIEHRLRVAGGGGKDLFTPDAYGMIFQHTGGASRLINALCDAALHAACLRAAGHVSSAEILVATQDPRWPEALAREKARPDGAGSPVSAAPAGNAAHAGNSSSDQGGAKPDSAAADPGPESQAPVMGPTSPESQPPVTGLTSAELQAPVTDPTSAQAQLYVRHRKRLIGSWPLEQGNFSIGRANDNELRLEAPFISRHHCRISTVGKVSTIEDLGSVNGMSINGRLVKKHVLEHADQVVLGEHSLTYLVT